MILVMGYLIVASVTLAGDGADRGIFHGLEFFNVENHLITVAEHFEMFRSLIFGLVVGEGIFLAGEVFVTSVVINVE